MTARHFRSAGPSAHYGHSIADFLASSTEAIVGALTSASGNTVERTQVLAWEESIACLRKALHDHDGHLFLEFVVPRLGSRIDAVAIIAGVIFPIEFKTGNQLDKRIHLDQAWDYALDLKNFHAGSHRAPILPILVVTDAKASESAWEIPHPDGVRRPLTTTPTGLRAAIEHGLLASDAPAVDPEEWARAPYHPTPTIVEAARALFAHHSVDSISRNDAGATNLRTTSSRVEEIIDDARAHGRKAIIFVTGVPGAGKTLVGLNIATRRDNPDSPTHAVFLSGNGPLVAVLREALVRDEAGRLKRQGAQDVRRGAIRQKVKPFIQNIHHFRDDGLRDRNRAPADRVVIFDEAQRAWNLAKTSAFMKQRKGIPDFDQSEPEFLISYLDRHEDWAVVVCLVGGGQEIHTGEAGITAWLEALAGRFQHWDVYISDRLGIADAAADATIHRLASEANVDIEPALHLATSMRSFRSEKVSDFVRAVLDVELARARELLGEFLHVYPMVVTRDLGAAKEWIRSSARGSERYGLVASSKAHRLKPHAVDIRVNVDPINWFLGDRDDTRSSWYLEDAATEFQVQGLEVDWALVTWDADLRFGEETWAYHQFKGDGWQRIHKADRRQYLVNAYRVLLTRARQGMAIFVPPGDPEDATRLPKYYDGTFELLRNAGVPVI